MVEFTGLFDTTYDYTLQFNVVHTSVHSHVFASCCSVAASNGGRSTSSGFPNHLRPQLQASHSNSSQRLNLSSSLSHWLTDWLTISITHQPTQLKSTPIQLTVLLITYRQGPHRKHRSIFLWHFCLFTKPLLSNGCCISVSFMAVVLQPVYMSQVYLIFTF
jgi:hypothetical protein